MLPISIICTLFVVAAARGQNSSCCQPGQQCWPSKADVAELQKALDPTAKRSLHWSGKPEPYTGAVPLSLSGTPTDQPLYALDPINPVYERQAFDFGCADSIGLLETNFCKASTRNLPAKELGEPAFVVWPLTAEHTQAAIRFANDHDICICVAGQAHDYMSRHSCNNGMLIRTGLMKDIKWNLGEDNPFPNAKDGSVRLGSGLTFSEVHHSGSLQKVPRFIAAGWVSTVGVIGWHTGGGHGPAARSVGAGVDNILEVELVNADGNLVTANATHNSDLLWGVRGGGGSIWGVITALTVKAHTSAEGISLMLLKWKGEMCGDEEKQYEDLIDFSYKFSINSDSRFSGTIWNTPSKSDGNCSASYEHQVMYIFLGANTSTIFQQAVADWTSIKEPYAKKETTYKTMWDAWALDGPEYNFHHPDEWYIYPIKSGFGGVKTVLMPTDVIASGAAANLTKANMAACKAQGTCFRHEIYNDIPGSATKVDADATCLAAGFHKADVHHIHSGAPGAFAEKFDALGDSAYFSESEGQMSDWKQRYWGDNYEKLLAIKQKYDPNNMFTCHHCVGSDLPRQSLSRATMFV